MHEPCFCAQDVGDMHILALLQQAQVQRAAEEALTSLDHSSRQAQVASEAQQDLDLKVMMPISITMLGLLILVMGLRCACVSIAQDSIQMDCVYVWVALSGACMHDLLHRALFLVKYMPVSLHLCSLLLSLHISRSTLQCGWQGSCYSRLCCATLVKVQTGCSLIDCAGSTESNDVSEAGFGIQTCRVTRSKC